MESRRVRWLATHIATHFGPNSDTDALSHTCTNYEANTATDCGTDGVSHTCANYEANTATDCGTDGVSHTCTNYEANTATDCGTDGVPHTCANICANIDTDRGTYVIANYRIHHCANATNDADDNGGANGLSNYVAHDRSHWSSTHSITYDAIEPILCTHSMVARLCLWCGDMEYRIQVQRIMRGSAMSIESNFFGDDAYKVSVPLWS